MGLSAAVRMSMLAVISVAAALFVPRVPRVLLALTRAVVVVVPVAGISHLRLFHVGLKLHRP